MKLRSFIIGVTVATALAAVQDMAAGETIPYSPNGQKIVSRPQADRYQQIAYVAPADRSLIAMNAPVSRRIFSADPNLYSETKPSGRSEAGIIEGWRERVFRILGSYVIPRRPDPVNDNRLKSIEELADQDNERRIITRVALKETLKLAHERLPEIDRLVNALKFEVSTDMISPERSGAEAADEKTGKVSVARLPVVKDRFFLRTGLRVPIESGKLGFVSETGASYGNLSSFFKVRLDGRFDSGIGLKYVLGRNLSLQVERQVSHAAEPATSGRTNTRSISNMIQVVSAF